MLCARPPGAGTAYEKGVADVTTVRIFQPSKTTMQSAYGNTKTWLLQFEAAAPRFHDPLMGWIGSSDTRQQLRLRFATREQAIAFAERYNLRYQIEEPRVRQVRPKNYAEKFRN